MQNLAVRAKTERIELVKASDVSAGFLGAGPRLYCQDPIPAGGRFVLPESVAHHVVRVLRLRVGDALTVFDGRGGEVAAELTRVERDRAEVVLGARSDIERECAYRIRLVQCLQGGDKMDFSIQKAVELGVHEIVPVQSRRSVVRLDGARAARRVEHWRQIVVAASEQCGRNRLAQVHEIEPLDRYLARPAAARGLRIFLSPGAEATVAALPAPDADMTVELLVGPEGGLAPEEAQAAQAAEFCKLRLGPRVLRTETAGLAALAAMHARWGDFL